MFYEPTNPHGLAHDPFKSLIIPRPIGWISTLDPQGNVNLAPYSFFNAVSFRPPIMMFSAGGKHIEGGAKDTASNAEACGEFVCNLTTWDLREAMNKTSASLPRKTDEFAQAGLTPIPSRLVRPPRVAESPVHLECRHYLSLNLPTWDEGEPNRVIFGEVIGIHIDDSVIKDGMIDIAALRPVARLGYFDYTSVEGIFTMPRPD